MLFAVIVLGGWVFLSGAAKVISYFSWVGYIVILAGALVTWCIPFGFACGIPIILAGAAILFFF